MHFGSRWGPHCAFRFAVRPAPCVSVRGAPPVAAAPRRARARAQPRAHGRVPQAQAARALRDAAAAPLHRQPLPRDRHGARAQAEAARAPPRRLRAR
eukprot:2246796-Prymnesium_polylepis.1